ncbi:zinc finger, RING/FYVE/PHD-type [Artemisia annua]|uniref:RING-type E3 ubiquitin transferase n=1 Tax=Artemisia annua TaxID=35608 RepID=A0A2U1MDB6_ARTAN|nr:zinc finger, RING/FYVE/PHD-type [Artemisia annua]
MSGTTTDTGDSYTTAGPDKADGGISYVLGLTFAIIILLITLSYASYKCNRRVRSSSVPPDDNDNNHQFRNVTRGVDDDVLKTFKTFVYSEDMMSQKDDHDTNGSGCSICLADYKAADVIRLLPVCGHLFHRQCIDTWLKVHATCPVCRNSPLPVKLSIQMS